MKIVPRDIPPRTVWTLEQAGVHPLLAQLYAARGVLGTDELDDGLARLLAPDSLLGNRAAATLLADAIALDRFSHSPGSHQPQAGMAFGHGRQGHAEMARVEPLTLGLRPQK